FFQLIRRNGFKVIGAIAIGRTV
ncbi:hypothetical protein D047_0586B, partial [Vibrio parahaemolyticus VPTS-2010_2]